MRGLRGEAAIAGVAEFAPTRKPEKLWMGLEAYSELARMALDDAGLSISDVDAVLTGNNLQEAQMFVPATIIEYLGVESHFSEVVDLGGASGAGLVLRAAMAIGALIWPVLVWVWRRFKPASPAPAATSR